MNHPDLTGGPAIPAGAIEGAHRALLQADQPSISLDPADDFPAMLAELTLVELQVLHSRVCLQLDSEYLGLSDGAHPVTLDRRQELAAELAVREDLLPVSGR